MYNCRSISSTRPAPITQENRTNWQVDRFDRYHPIGKVMEGTQGRGHNDTLTWAIQGLDNISQHLSIKKYDLPRSHNCNGGGKL
jgi:hypothetical protein